MTKKGHSHTPGEASLRWNQTPVSKPPSDPIFHVPPKESKVSKAREARRSQLAYEIEKRVAIRHPIVPIRAQDRAAYDEFRKG